MTTKKLLFSFLLIFMTTNPFRSGAVGILSCRHRLPSLTSARQASRNDTTAVHFIFNVIKEGNVSLPAGLSDTLKKTQKMLDMVFSSEEFKDSLCRHSFADSSYSKSKKGCFAVVRNPKTGRVDGLAVYNNLLASEFISIDLVIRQTPEINKNKKTKTQGFSSACVYRITTYDYWIKPGQPLAYRFARHIAHEFTHIRGYRHDNKVPAQFKWGHNPNDDPAYGVGKIVGDILKRWHML